MADCAVNGMRDSDGSNAGCFCGEPYLWHTNVFVTPRIHRHAKSETAVALTQFFLIYKYGADTIERNRTLPG
jgi:hypothetical protein